MTIKILNEEINIRFCMAVEIEFEEISGEAFSMEALKKIRNTVALGMAAIKVSNPDTKITMDLLEREATGQEIASLNNAVIESMTEWLAIPKVVANEDAKESQSENDDERKN